jgi:hypothetical protein
MARATSIKGDLGPWRRREPFATLPVMTSEPDLERAVAGPTLTVLQRFTLVEDHSSVGLLCALERPGTHLAGTLCLDGSERRAAGNANAVLRRLESIETHAGLAHAESGRFRLASHLKVDLHECRRHVEDNDKAALRPTGPLSCTRSTRSTITATAPFRSPVNGTPICDSTHSMRGDGGRLQRTARTELSRVESSGGGLRADPKPSSPMVRNVVRLRDAAETFLGSGMAKRAGRRWHPGRM